MKKLIIMSALVMGGLGINNANAQFGIHINLHLGASPVYVPAPQPGEVDQNVYNDDYYYLPEVEAYYSVAEQCYYYQDGDRWISAAYLPGRYHDYDWRSARRFEIHADRPYMHHDAYRGKFGGYANRNDYYAKAYPNRGGFDRHDDRDHYQYGNRGWNNQNRDGQDRHDDRNPNNGYNQSGQNRGQDGYNQPSQPQQNQGGQNRSRGGNQQQPSQGQQGDNRGNSQPANHNSGQQRGNDEHYTANKMGMTNDRVAFARPVRN